MSSHLSRTNERARGRWSLGLVGPGRAGTAVFRALSAAGMQVSAVCGATPGSGRAASFADEVHARHVPTPAEVARVADVVIIAVPDSFVAGVARDLAAARPVRARAFGHLSGALPVAALDNLSARGFDTFGLHIALPFAGLEVAPESIAGASAAIAGAGDGLVIARDLGNLVGVEMFELDDAARPLYHAACVLASNALVALEDLAMRTATAAGVTDPANLLLPLVKATVENLARAGAAEALTGPVARGDVGTVAAHLNAIEAEVPDAVAAYEVLARHAATLAELDETALARLTDVLDANRQGDAA